MRSTLLSFVAAALGAPAAAQFSISGFALPPQASWTDGVELADVDDDGDVDVLFANGSGYGAGGALAQHLFLNDGSGTFSSAHAQLGVAAFNAKMVIAEDLDGDGDLDLVYAAESGWPAPTDRPRVLINDGTGSFSDQSAARLPAVNMASFCVCAGDVDDDADLDLVFTDGATFVGVPTQAHLFVNDGAGFFSDATAASLPADLYNAQDVVLFDWEGDFDLDITLSGKGTSGNRSRLYLNDGSGAFARSTLLDGLGTSSTYEIEWGDLDGDQDLDGLVQSLSGFSEGVAFNGIASITTQLLPNPNGDDDNEMAGLDYDDDGDLDLLVGSLGPSEKLYRNDGGGAFASASNLIQAQADSTLDLGVADLDGDDDYDFVTAQGETGVFVNKVYLSAGPPDSHAPRVLGVEAPAYGAAETVFHARTQDAIQDDGDAGFVTGAFRAWQGSPAGVALATGAAFHQGGGSWRAAVPTLPGASGVALCWAFTDAAGNRAESAVTVGSVLDWTDLGHALAGGAGPPALAGSGTPAPGAPVSLQITGANPASFGGLVIGSSTFFVPILGGVLVPRNTAVLLFFTDPAGAASVQFHWPTGLPGCTVLYLQALIRDFSAPERWSFTNALAAIQR
jgi:hypothetical protein